MNGTFTSVGKHAMSLAVKDEYVCKATSGGIMWLEGIILNPDDNSIH